jgi:hypothetical protein
MLGDSVHCLFFCLVLGHCESESICAEPTRTTNAVHKVSEVWMVESALLSQRDIIVKHKVYLRHVNASSQHIRGDEAVEFLLAESINDLVALLSLNSANKHMRGDVADRLEACL